MAYTNSPLVSYTRLSPHNSGTRTHAIDRITPHHVVGLMSVEALGAEFSGAANKSSNYGIGADGRVGMYVPESCRSWASNSWDNDQRAVTIECSDEATYPWKFPEVVYDRLIELCADICRRNGKKKLLWRGTKAAALAYEPKADEMVLTMHKFFISTQCPGVWMESHMGDLAEKVTALLGADTSEETEENTVNICEIELPVLKLGSKGQSVRTLQTLLIAQKFSCGGWGADGDFGNGTLTAVRNFQTLRKLGADGIVGAKTWAELTKF